MCSPIIRWSMPCAKLNWTAVPAQSCKELYRIKIREHELTGPQGDLTNLKAFSMEVKISTYTVTISSRPWTIRNPQLLSNLIVSVVIYLSINLPFHNIYSVFSEVFLFLYIPKQGSKYLNPLITWVYKNIWSLSYHFSFWYRSTNSLEITFLTKFVVHSLQPSCIFITLNFVFMDILSSDIPSCMILEALFICLFLYLLLCFG